VLPPVGSKYKLLVEPEGKHYGQVVYADMNSDSISEQIISGKGAPFYFITVRDNELRFYDQWNLKDSLNPSISEFFIGNYDHDNFKEIYIFSHKKDSLFLSMNEILQPSGTKMERIFISKIGYLNSEVSARVEPAGFFDENGDGKDEIYFVIGSNFQLGPRGLYYFDLDHKSLKSSQFTGTICMNPVMVDVNGDQKPEIFGTMAASGNYRSNVPYSDSSTWLMVFDDKLNFEFPPVEFPGFANGLEIKAYEKSTEKGYVLSHYAGGTDTTVLKSRIMLFSPEGKLITYRLYSDFGMSGSPKLLVIRYNQTDRIYVINNGKIFEFGSKLESVRIIDLPFKSQTFDYQYDINGDGQDELMIYSEDEEKMIVYNGELSKLTELGSKAPDTELKFSHYYSKDHLYKIFLRSGDRGYFLRLDYNGYYYLSYLTYPGIYLLSFLFIFLVKKINTYQVVHKESLNRRLVTLQLQGIKTQLDPHFTFNSLNSIASLIYLEDRQAAYDYLIKFTQLLRGILNDAERIYRSLGEELEFVTTYLDLEKLRFGEKFNYEIEIGEGISQKEKVPKMVLQTFAENAVKHGIMPGAEGGLLKIRVEKETDYLRLIIEDNGIGREAAAGHSTSTGKGLKITGEFYDILNQMNKKQIKHSISDLYNKGGEPAGTRVEVWVPLNIE
jgi:hypothetical protein